MNTKAIPYIVILGGIYGCTTVASRFGVDQLHPISFIAVRFLIASTGFIIIYTLRIKGHRFPRDRKVWMLSVFLGIFSTLLPNFLLVSSLQYQSSGVTSILITTSPAITVLIAHFALEDERLTARKGIGILFALGGALFLALSGETGLEEITTASPVGYLLAISAILIASVMTVFGRIKLRDMDPVAVTAINTFTAAVIAVPVMVFGVRQDFSTMTSTGWIAVLFAAVFGTFVGMLLGFSVLKQYGATSLAMTNYLVPVFAGIGGVWLLSETITGRMLIGMALIIAGVWLINSRPRYIRFILRPKI